MINNYSFLRTICGSSSSYNLFSIFESFTLNFDSSSRNDARSIIRKNMDIQSRSENKFGAEDEKKWFNWKYRDLKKEKKVQHFIGLEFFTYGSKSVVTSTKVWLCISQTIGTHSNTFQSNTCWYHWSNGSLKSSITV